MWQQTVKNMNKEEEESLLVFLKKIEFFWEQKYF